MRKKRSRDISSVSHLKASKTLPRLPLAPVALTATYWQSKGKRENLIFTSDGAERVVDNFPQVFGGNLVSVESVVRLPACRH